MRAISQCVGIRIYFCFVLLSVNKCESIQVSAYLYVQIDGNRLLLYFIISSCVQAVNIPYGYANHRHRGHEVARLAVLRTFENELRGPKPASSVLDPRLDP